MTSAAVVLALCRFGQDTAALLLWGASAYLAWLVPKDIAVAPRLGRWGEALVVTVAVVTVARLPAEVASIGDGWRDSVDPTMVLDVLRNKGVGHAWAAQTMMAVVLALVQPLGPAFPQGRSAVSGQS